MTDPQIYTKQEAEAKRIVEQAAYSELMTLREQLAQAERRLGEALILLKKWRHGVSEYKGERRWQADLDNDTDGFFLTAVLASQTEEQK